MAAINSPLKAALTLFAPSFNRLPLVPHHTARIKASVKGKYDTYSLGSLLLNKTWQPGF